MPDKNNPNASIAKTQCNQILSFLQSGNKITGLTALNLFGVMHLPRRILDLKERGHKVKDNWIKKNKKRFKEYYLMM